MDNKIIILLFISLLTIPSLASIQIDNIRLNWDNSAIDMYVNVTATNADNCTFGGNSGTINSGTAYIDISDAASQNGDVTCYTTDGYNDKKFINFTFVDNGESQYPPWISDTNTQYAQNSISYHSYANSTYYSIKDSVSGGTCVGTCSASGQGDGSVLFVYSGSWVSTTESLYGIYQNMSTISNLTTQYVYNQTQLNISTTTGFDWDKLQVGNSDAWVRWDGVVNGFSTGYAGFPSMAFNVTGDGNWTLINGEVSGFYWNGTQWVSDNSRVSGLPGSLTRPAPEIAFNVTGDGNWTLIFGERYGKFYGYYWNGTQWVSDSNRVSGLADVNDGYSSPTMAFNVTGDGNWTLISGGYDGVFYGYYWNGTQWVDDSSKVVGLGDIGSYSAPEIAFNVTGDGNWTLISSSNGGAVYGYYWNGTQWVSDDIRASGIWTSSEDQHQSFIAVAFNVTGDGNWISVVRDSYGGTSGDILNPSYTAPCDITTIGNPNTTNCNHNGFSGDWLDETEQITSQAQNTTQTSTLGIQYAYNQTNLTITDTLGVDWSNVDIGGYYHWGWENNNNKVVAGLGDIGSYSSPSIAFNVTGDGNWTLISGGYDGVFYGYYWNGTQWVDDSSRVTGLGDVGTRSTPALAFNVTGDGNWTLISGYNLGGFYGFYWNGTQWVSDSSKVVGLGDIGSYSSPSIAFNVTGDGNWTLISGDDFGGFYGFYWNGTQWVSNSNRVGGVPFMGYYPTYLSMAFNVTGDGTWEMIAGQGYDLAYGYYWNGTQWVSDSSRVSGITNGQSYFSPSLAFNITGDGGWRLISGGYGGIFVGHLSIYQWWDTPILVDSSTTTLVNDYKHTYFSGDWLDESESLNSVHQNTSAQSSLSTQYAYNQTQMDISNSFPSISWVDVSTGCAYNTSVDISTTANITDCNHNGFSGDWIADWTDISTEYQNTSVISNLTTQYVVEQSDLYSNETLGIDWMGVNVSGVCSENQTAIDVTAGSSNAEYVINCVNSTISGDWLDEEVSTYTQLQNESATSTLDTQYAYNQTQLKVSDELGIDWTNISPSVCDKNTTAFDLSSGASAEVVNTNCTWVGFSGDWLDESESLNSVHQNTSAQSSLSTQYAYNQTQMDISNSFPSISWVDVSTGCAYNTSVDISTTANITDCNHNGFSGDWLDNYTLVGETIQDTSTVSNLNTQYLQNNTDLYINETLGINWENIANTEQCDVNISSFDVAANGLVQKVTTGCQSIQWNGDWLDEEVSTYTQLQNESATSTLDTQYAYNQTQLKVSDELGIDWTNISPSVCDKNTTAFDLSSGASAEVVNTNCTWVGFNGDWLDESESLNSVHQNTTETSTLSTQYAYNQTQLTSTNTLNVNWTNIDISSICSYSSSMSVPALDSSTAADCNHNGYSGDWLDETVGIFEQDPTKITYVNGSANIRKSLGIVNNLNVPFSSVDISTINTRPTWSCDSTSLDVPAGGYNSYWQCSKDGIIIQTSQEENYTQDITQQDYILPTDTDLHITADVYVNNTDDAVSYSNVRYANGLMAATFNINNNSEELVHPTGTNSLTVTKDTYDSIGCSGWLGHTDVYTYSTTFPNGNISGVRFKFNLGSDWTNYNGYVCNRTTADCGFASACDNGEWAEIGLGLGSTYLLHNGAPAGFDFEHLSSLRYAISYSTPGGSSNEGGGGGGGGSVVSCPEGMYYDQISQQCRRGTLDIEPSSVSGNASQGEVKSELLLFKNIGSTRTSVKLAPTISGILVIPTDFELQAGEEKQIEVRSSIPLTADSFQEGLDIYQDGAYFATIPISYSVSVGNGMESQLQPLLGVSPKTMHAITALLFADPFSIGVKSGAFAVVILAAIAVFYWKKKRGLSLLMLALIGLIILITGGKLLL